MCVLIKVRSYSGSAPTAFSIKPGYTITQSKYSNALNASSRATPRVHMGERKDTGGAQIYMR